MSEQYDEDDLKEGDVLAGKYRVERVIGEGGMGLVVAAVHTVLEERVAIKMLHSHVVENEAIAARFLREAQAAVKIKSPHVARALDVGTLESGAPFMVMEHLSGVTLGVYMEQEAPLGIEQACTFALQTCEALAAAHAAGIIHRDIKPANLFVTQTPDGREIVKVLDFGISKVASDIGGAALTATQVSMGSPLYMSPEQMRSARSVDSRADIWSLGVVLYEMLTGQLPFNADSMPQLCALVLEGDAPRAHTMRDDIPMELEDVVHRCLQRSPDDRFSDVGELAEALAPFAGAEGVASAQRAVRIMEGAGMGKTLSERGERASAASGSASDANGAIRVETDTAFGKTEASVSTRASRRSALLWATAGAAVLVIGAALLLSRPRAAPSAAPSAEPSPAASGSTAPSEPPASAAAPTTPAASASASAAASAETAEKPADDSRPAAPARHAPRAPAPRPEEPDISSVFDERL